jgi:diguanylate cyclase (GGDEF)-like protein/PAS domain S-box-containing protein
MDTLGWETIVAPLMRALSYAIVAMALTRLFRSRQTAFLGMTRWLVVASLLISTALQFVMLGARFFDFVPVLRFARVFDAGFLLAAAIMVWPFMVFMTRRMSRTTSRRLRRYITRAKGQAGQARRLLEMSEELSHTGHWTLSLPDREIFWSDEIYRIHGLEKGPNPPDFHAALEAIHPDDRTHVEALIAGAIVGKTPYEFEAGLLRPDGEIRNVHCRGMPKLDDAGKVTGLFGVFTDLTEQKKIQDQLQAAIQAAENANHVLSQLALLDSLTGLPNRRHFDAAAATEFKRAIRERTGLGIVMIDLDHFKGYNDHFGHPAGDECLRKVAAAIAAASRRPGDLAARYGGEEFIVLLPSTDAAGAGAVAAIIQAAVAALRIPHPANPPLIATISCGTAVCEPAHDGHVLLALMRRADQALYEAKRAGRNCVVNSPAPAASRAANV